MVRRIVASAVAFAVMTGAAWAADLPNTKGPPAFAPPPPPVFSWTGLYVGGQIGYQWGDTHDPTVYARAAPATFASLSTYNDDGVIGGAHVGYNFQLSQFVLGIEGDINGSSYNGSVTQIDPANAALILRESTRIGIEGSVRGRVGWAWDRILIYGTGGAAFASISSGFSEPNFPGNGTFSTNTGRVGWTGGGGIEYAFDPNWSVRAEYRYSDYGRVTYPLDSIVGAAGDNFTKRITANMVEAGFSYKFDMFAPPTPVVAKY